MKTNAWEGCTDAAKKKIDLFSENYKSFLSQAKTERECIKYFTSLLQQNGFKDLKGLIAKNKKLAAGDRVYITNMDKALVAYVIGEKDLEEGMDILCAHIDSPRLDLKSRPLYEDGEFCLFDTHYYGGIKHYQWTALPLALHGLVCRKDGSKTDFSLGEKAGEPVFAVTDLLPHLSTKDGKDNKMTGEDLNLIVGSQPKNKSVKDNVIEIMKGMGIIGEIDDFYSAEIEAVPAGEARDFGFDRSMIMGYGHDDRSCAYACAKAIIDAKSVKKTACVILIDKEEIGSEGATGMKSKFFENVTAEVMNLMGEYKELLFKRALSASQVISCDVTAGFDPNWPQPSNKNTEAFLNRGIAFCKYNGSRGKSDSNDANPEFIAKLRNVLDKNKIEYQFTEMGKVDIGGGGTIANILAAYGMEVIDAGVPVLSMHAPWEVISKLDLYENYRFYKAFLESV